MKSINISHLYKRKICQVMILRLHRHRILLLVDYINYIAWSAVAPRLDLEGMTYPPHSMSQLTLRHTCTGLRGHAVIPWLSADAWWGLWRCDKSQIVTEWLHGLLTGYSQRGDSRIWLCPVKPHPSNPVAARLHFIPWTDLDVITNQPTGCQ